LLKRLKIAIFPHFLNYFSDFQESFVRNLGVQLMSSLVEGFVFGIVVNILGLPREEAHACTPSTQKTKIIHNAICC